MRAPGRGRREACRCSLGPLDPGLLSPLPSPTAAAGKLRLREAGRGAVGWGPVLTSERPSLAWSARGDHRSDLGKIGRRAWAAPGSRSGPWPLLPALSARLRRAATAPSGDAFAFRSARGRVAGTDPSGWPRNAAAPRRPLAVLPPPLTSLLEDGPPGSASQARPPTSRSGGRGGRAGGGRGAEPPRGRAQSLDVLVSARAFWGYFCAERPVRVPKRSKGLTLSFREQSAVRLDMVRAFAASTSESDDSVRGGHLAGAALAQPGEWGAGVELRSRRRGGLGAAGLYRSWPAACPPAARPPAPTLGAVPPASPWHLCPASPTVQ